jgi:hypothetical protein
MFTPSHISANYRSFCWRYYCLTIVDWQLKKFGMLHSLSIYLAGER